jgi:hypothetical protein
VRRGGKGEGGKTGKSGKRVKGRGHRAKSLGQMADGRWKIERGKRAQSKKKRA